MAALRFRQKLGDGNYWLLMRCMKECGLPPQPETWSCLPAKSVDLGVPLAQYELARIYDKRFKDYNTRERLLDCAARQGFSAAMNELSRVKRIRYGNLKESLQLMHNCIALWW